MDTTLYVGPIDPEGYVDYAAAVEVAFGDADAEHHDNAFVGLLANVDTAQWPAGHLDEVRRRLNVAPAADDAELLEPFPSFATETQGMTEEAAFELLKEALRGEWVDPNAFPQVLAWLEAMETPLNKLRDASRRTHYFVPLVIAQNPDGTRGLINGLLPHLGSSGIIAKALLVRARVRLSRGAWSQAVDDIVAVASLASLQTRDTTLISVLVGHSNRSLAHAVIRRLLNEPDVSARDIARLGTALAALPAPRPMERVIDQGERAVVLDTLQQIRRGNTTVQALLSKRRGSNDPLTTFVRSPSTDLDALLREINLLWDGLLDGREPPPRVTMPELMRAVKESAGGDDAQHPTQLFARWFVDVLQPAISPALVVDQKITMQKQLEQVGFALVLYESEHGRFPAALPELQPDFISELPIDVFSGAPLIYRREGRGCVVYSVSGNGQDDDGLDDASADGDLVLRIRR